MAAVTSASDLLAAPSKRSRGLADIDPKFVSNSGLSGLSELGTPRGGSVRIQHRPPKHPANMSSSSNNAAGGVGGVAGVITSCSASSAAAAVETSRFPKLDECAHFHYDVVDLGPLTIQLHEETGKVVSSSIESEVPLVALQITSYGKSWVVRRSYEHFRLLDEQLHRCIYDRKFSQLPLLPENVNQPAEVALRPLLSNYVNRLSAIAGNLINCAPVLNWLEVDNRGRRLYPPPPSDDADAEINTPAVAAAYAVRRYAAVASDEISFEVGDMISVIDMPPPEESMWWRGKRGFDVGFFPSECVRIIGDKVPAHLSLPNTTPVVVVGSHSGSGGKTQHLLNQSGCSGGSGGSSAEHLPTKPVLRKHGKLISFFRSFILSRPSRRKLKQSGILKERVFGCDLGEHLLNSGREIPMVLKCCAEFIEEYGIVDGIYRLSGITSNIQKLRNAFDEDRVPALVEDEAIRQDMHAVSSLLKMYFRELPNPLCTYQLYDQFVNAVQGPDNLRVVRMREVVQQLPPPHFRTLEYLTRHLARVAENNASTGMTAKNVAIVWAPNLLRCKELEFGGVAALQGVGVQAVVTECLVRYVDLIFSDKVPAMPVQLTSDEQSAQQPSSSGGGALKRTRPKSLAISTPTKLLSLEEARNRALQLASSQNDTQYIEVGGGPASLPPKYHTVIELPNGDARSKRGHSLKHKKSPLGWKSLFAKPSKGRSPSTTNKAQRKNSSASTSSTVSMPAQVASCSSSSSTMTPQRSVTYIRPRLRPVKSAESLVASNRNSSAGDSQLTSPADIAAATTTVNKLGAEQKNAAECIGASPMLREGDDSCDGRRLAGDGDDDESIQDGSLSRCHNRSVSHDSYFRLLMTNSRTGMQVDPLDEEGDASPEAVSDECHQGQSNDAIYAEISKSATKNSKEETRTRGSPSESQGLEFGKNMNLTSVEDPHSGSSKMSLIDLSHLDDSELNIMNSREMLAVSKKLSDNSSRHIRDSSSGSSHSEEEEDEKDGSCVGRARPASVDDSVIDDSARGMPMNAEQIDGKGNWAASNPAYELFCIQAEVHHHHHHHHHRMETGGRSPSPDNTDAQMPDMPSEMAMDGDNDSLVNVTTEDYSSTEVPGGSEDRESYTLHGLNDVYENVNVADNRTTDVESLRRTTSSPAPASYENFADNHAYAMVRVSSSQDATYENVIDPAIIDEEYEPIEPPLESNQQPSETVAVVSYENVDQAKYENVDQHASGGTDPDFGGQCNYENLDNQPSYENIDEGNGTTVVVVPSCNDAIDVDGGETYENVVLSVRDNSNPSNSKSKPLEMVNVYEDVIPPPPRTDETEEVIYYQVKVLRQSIQEVNELLREDPTVLQIAIADLGEYPVRNNTTTPSPVKIRNSPAKEVDAAPLSMTANKRITMDASTSQTSAPTAKDSLSLNDAKLSSSTFVIKDIAVDEVAPKMAAPPKGVRLSLSPKMSISQDSSQQRADSTRNVKEQPHHHLPLSVSLPSLLNANNKLAAQKQMATAAAAPAHVNTSLPPTPLYDLHPESESVSSKRRFESEIGRDLLRERRIRNEIENSRRSESNLLQSSEQATSPVRRLSTSESSSSSSLSKTKPPGGGGKPALPIKLNSKKTEPTGRNVQLPVSPVKKPEVQVRPTTLETSFDYEPIPLERRASSPLSTGSPLSPVSPTSEGRNFTSSAARKTSVKELLNKFQTGGDSERSNQQQPRVSTPTSPVKPATPVSSPNNKQQQQQQQLATHILDESSKKMKDEGKENIEVHLTPPQLKSSTINHPVESERCEMMLLVESNSEPCKSIQGLDSSAMDQDAKELLRQKSLGIDMSDPRTRLRIERYKEERRSFLREKYKSESFRSDSKEDAVIVRLKQKAGSPTHQQQETGGHMVDDVGGNSPPPPPPSLQTPDPGLIDEDVNVKERAAQWAQTLPATLVAAAAVAAAATTVVSPSPALVPMMATSPIKTVSPTHRSCSEAVGIVPQHKRIRDMAALFEKETP